MFEVISVLRGAVGLAAAGQTEARPFPSQGATWGRASRGEGSPKGPQAARAAPQAARAQQPHKQGRARGRLAGHGSSPKGRGKEAVGRSTYSKLTPGHVAQLTDK